MEECYNEFSTYQSIFSVFRLNIALNQRGVTANRVAMCEMTELEKQIIEEEIRRVTGGTLGNTTVKFYTPPTAAAPAAVPEDPPKLQQVHASQMTRSVQSKQDREALSLSKQKHVSEAV